MAEPSLERHPTVDPAEDDVSFEPASRDADMRAYLGPNADAYLPLWHDANRISKQVSHHQAMMTHRYSWAAALVPLPWLFYRKLWIWGALSIIGPIVVELVVGPLSGTSALAFVMLFFGKNLVIARGDKVIAAVAATNSPPAAAREKIAAAGGVSIVGALLGSAIFAAQLVLIFVGAAHR